MGLFKPVWMTEKMSKEDKAIAAVREIRDQGKLYEIAVNAPLPGVIRTAIECLEDDRLLAEYARTVAEHYNTRDLALSRIKDQDLLAQFALTGGHWLAGRAASYVKDPGLLLEIAMSCSPAAADCASRISDPEAKRMAEEELKRKDRERKDLSGDAPVRMSERLKKAEDDELRALIPEAYEQRRDRTYREPWTDIEEQIEWRIRGLAQSRDTALLQELAMDGRLGYKACLACFAALFSKVLDDEEGIGELRGKILEDFIARRLSSGDVSHEFVRLACTLPPDAQKMYGFEVYTTENGRDEPDGHVTWETTHVRWRDRYYSDPE